MYFCGLTKCFDCGNTETLKPNVSSNWRAIKAESKIYYFCVNCQPDPRFPIFTNDWTNRYKKWIEKIYYADFNRPINKILVLRDAAQGAEIYANLN